MATSPTAHITQVTTPEEFGALLMAGDPRCEIPLGSRVVKICAEPHDHHLAGSEGTVKGSVHLEDALTEVPGVTSKDAYLVLFDGDEQMTFCTGSKLAWINH